MTYRMYKMRAILARIKRSLRDLESFLRDVCWSMWFSLDWEDGDEL